jgi:hypothetical protein
MPMTEAEWLACADPFLMLRWLHPRRVSRRKYRLFGAACCLRAWQMGAGVRCHGVAAALERLADRRAGVIGRAVQAIVWDLARPAGQEAQLDLANRFEYAAVQPANAWWTAHRAAEVWLDWVGAAGGAARVWEAVVVAHLLRDIIGNSGQSSPSLPPNVLAWNDGTVRRIAEAIYEERQTPAGTLDTARLAILADALLDAGCEDEDLLAHCRSAGPHVRGCWALDLILGKE